MISDIKEKVSRFSCTSAKEKATTVTEYSLDDMDIIIALTISCRDNFRQLFVFDQDGEYIAMMEYFPKDRTNCDDTIDNHRARFNKYFFINDSFTKKNYRGHGIHSLLFNIVCYDAKYNGYDDVELVPNDTHDLLGSPSYELQRHYINLGCNILTPDAAKSETYIGYKELDDIVDNIRFAPHNVKNLIRSVNAKYVRIQKKLQEMDKSFE